MKKFILYIILFSVLVSCTRIDDGSVPAAEEDMFGVVGRMPDSSKSSPSIWDDGDIVGVVPVDGVSMQARYSVCTVSDDNKSALFDGGAWNVKAGKRYAAYFPFCNDALFAGDSVIINLNGLYQTGNSSVEHIKEVDLMYANSVAPSNGQCMFEFGRKLCILTLHLISATKGTYSSVELSSDSGFPSCCIMRLMDGATDRSTVVSSISLGLDNLSVDRGEALDVTFALYPFDYSSETITLKATRTDGKVYYATFANCRFVPGELEMEALICPTKNEMFHQGDLFDNTDFSLL